MAQGGEPVISSAADCRPVSSSRQSALFVATFASETACGAVCRGAAGDRAREESSRESEPGVAGELPMPGRSYPGYPAAECGVPCRGSIVGEVASSLRRGGDRESIRDAQLKAASSLASGHRGDTLRDACAHGQSQLLQFSVPPLFVFLAVLDRGMSWPAEFLTHVAMIRFAALGSLMHRSGFS
jgi:hypothetical protein